ncbi:MAG: aspartate aminotransferase family protein [Clostridiales bacterium]|jgi:acetylornithine aminotransferase/acetylornithine/N-succinyldiaminopimelate aminotransferase|nr:aspartate aminotransferase family protein [Clostridiales bacterium]
MTTIEKGEQYVMNTYKRFPVAFERGEGMYLYDESGKAYLDFCGGIAVNSLGAGDRGLVGVVAAQSWRLIHTSNLYWTKPMADLAETLVTRSSFDKAFFCNSGAEAVEAAMKLARKYGADHGRFKIVAMENSFHGRTFGAITATGQKKYQKGLSPLLPGIVHVPFGDFEALESAADDETCAILLEPVQGEGGIIPAEREYLASVRRLCDDRGIALIFDEVQCGVGRLGYLFAHEYFGVAPDMCALAKGIAGGVPMGALLARAKFAAAFAPGDHASTFGGNPLAAAAANYVVSRVLAEGFLENVRETGAYLASSLEKLSRRNPAVLAVRGAGLMRGAVMSVPTGPLVGKCLERGLLTLGAGADVVRFVPPLIAGKPDVDKAMELFENALG